MQVVLEIPDRLATQLQTNGRSLPQRAMEDLAVEAYRLEELSLGQLAEMLDVSINDANGILKARGILDDFSLEEFEEQRKSMERLLGK
jgi:predicted HTH domain antitoxin